MIYYFLFFLLSIGSLLELNLSSMDELRYKKIQLLFYVVLSVYIVLLSGLRYKTGNDFDFYLPYFEGKIHQRVEVGYYFLNVFFKTVVNNYYVMQFFIETVCGILIFCFIIKHSRYPIFSLLAYFVFFFPAYNLAMIRQHIAISILTLAYKPLCERKFRKFLLIVIIASLFHQTAIIVLFFYFIKKNKSVIFILFFGYIILLFKGGLVVQTILNAMLHLPFVPVLIRDKINLYMQFYFLKHNEISSSLGFGFICTLAISVVALLYNKYYYSNYSYISFFTGNFFLSFNTSIDVFSRFGSYFLVSFGGFFVYGIIVRSWKSRKELAIFGVLFDMIFLFYFFLVFYFVFVCNGSATFPYDNVLFPHGYRE